MLFLQHQQSQMVLPHWYRRMYQHFDQTLMY